MHSVDPSGRQLFRSPLIRWIAWPAIILAAIAIRLPQLTESLWFDEVWRTNTVLRSGNLRQLLFYDVHNPLYNAFMYSWTGLFGDSELSIRLPSLLFGLAGIALLWRWMRGRFGEAPAALAAWIQLLSPVHAWYSCEAKNNMLVVLLGVLLLIQADSLLRRRRWRDAVLLSVWTVLGILTSWQAALAVLPIWITGGWLAWRPPRIEREGTIPRASPHPLLLLVSSILMSLAILSPLLIFKASQAETLARWYPLYPSLALVCKFILIWLPTGNALVRINQVDWPIWALAFGSVIAPALAVGGWLLRATSAGRLVVACLILPLAGMLATASICSLMNIEPPRIYQERNLLVVLPWFTVVLAVGATGTRFFPRLAAAVILIISLASSLAAITWRADKTTVMNPNPDWRSAAAYIRQSAPAGAEPPIIVSCCPLLPLKYYTVPGPLVEIDFQRDVADQVAQQRALHPAAEVFFINNPLWFGHPADQLASLEARLGAAERRDFLSLEIYRLAPLNPAQQPTPTAR